MAMSHKAISFSRAGRNKPNEDSILIKELGDSAILLGIADGMGGKPGGATASKTVIQTAAKVMEAAPSTSVEMLFDEAQKALLSISREYEELTDMATTLSLVLIKDNQAVIGHVGDCRIYHLRENGLISRTKDQTEVQRLIDDGILSKQRAKNYHRKNILLSVINASGAFDLQINKFEIAPGDRLILLTDGAYSLIQKSEIRDASVACNSLEEFLSEVQKKIESRPIRDDYSVVAFEVR